TWEPDAIITSIPLPNGDEHQVNNEPTQPITHFTASNSDAIFSSLLVRCVVQLELVDAVNSIVFGPSASRKEDAHALPSLAISSSPTDTTASPSRTMLVNGDMRNDSGQKSSNMESDSAADGLYSYIGVAHLLNLVDCLLDSHSLAKKFNGNNAQRTLLWKAGFKGRSKPNLLRQETHSMRSALCILFRIYVDVERTDAAQKNVVRSRLLRVLEDAVSYYVDLNSEQHRQAWVLVLYLILDWANSFSNAQHLPTYVDFAVCINQI
uniref:SEC7 domain-containing protein n=1 Tax=Parascaris univalens TaxID=6257 RepID=A0A915AAQ6_PARUN